MTFEFGSLKFEAPEKEINGFYIQREHAGSPNLLWCISLGKDVPTEIRDRAFHLAKILHDSSPPNISKIVGYSKTGGLHDAGYILLERLKDNLARRLHHCADTGQFLEGTNIKSETEKMGMVLHEILKGLTYLHSYGIVVGNLYPEMIEVSSDLEVVNIACLPPIAIEDGRGLAWETAYRAPEVFDNNSGKIQPQADVYSVGMIGYAMLIGIDTFDDAFLEQDINETTDSIDWSNAWSNWQRSNRLPPSVQEYRNIPEVLSLEGLLGRLANKDQVRRPETAENALADVQQVLQKEGWLNINHPPGAGSNIEDPLGLPAEESQGITGWVRSNLMFSAGAALGIIMFSVGAFSLFVVKPNAQQACAHATNIRGVIPEADALLDRGHKKLGGIGFFTAGSDCSSALQLAAEHVSNLKIAAADEFNAIFQNAKRAQKNAQLFKTTATFKLAEVAFADGERVRQSANDDPPDDQWFALVEEAKLHFERSIPLFDASKEFHSTSESLSSLFEDAKRAKEKAQSFKSTPSFELAETAFDVGDLARQSASKYSTEAQWRASVEEATVGLNKSIPLFDASGAFHAVADNRDRASTSSGGRKIQALEDAQVAYNRVLESLTSEAGDVSKLITSANFKSADDGFKNTIEIVDHLIDWNATASILNSDIESLDTKIEDYPKLFENMAKAVKKLNMFDERVRLSISPPHGDETPNLLDLSERLQNVCGWTPDEYGEGQLIQRQLTSASPNFEILARELERVSPTSQSECGSVIDCSAIALPGKFVEVPAGLYQVGSLSTQFSAVESSGLIDQEIVIEKSFCIATVEVTIDDYQSFLNETGASAEPFQLISWSSRRGHESVDRLSYLDAKSYSVWLGNQSELPVALPAPNEWVAAMVFAENGHSELALSLSDSLREWTGGDCRPDIAGDQVFVMGSEGGVDGLARCFSPGTQRDRVGARLIVIDAQVE